MSDQTEHPESEEDFVSLGEDSDEGSRSRLADLLKAGTDGFVRESYRLPMASVAGMTLTVEGNSFDILDLGLGGVRFILDRRDRFTIGDTVSDISLALGDKPLTVGGEVVHVSLGPDKTPQCGVRFVFGSEQDQAVLDEFIQNIMTGMFA